MISPIISAGSTALEVLEQLASAHRAHQASSAQGASSTGQTFPTGNASPGSPPSGARHGGSSSLVSPSMIGLLNSLQSADPVAEQAAAGAARQLADGARGVSHWLGKLEAQLATGSPAPTSTIGQSLSSLGTSSLATLASTASTAATALAGGSSTTIASALGQLGSALQGVTQAFRAYQRASI